MTVIFLTCRCMQGQYMQVNIKSRASNRLKYHSGLGSGFVKFIFSGLALVQVFRCLILQV